MTTIKATSHLDERAKQEKKKNNKTNQTNKPTQTDRIKLK